jgi:glycosyltransferase involved in cell wall biosynthesis
VTDAPASSLEGVLRVAIHAQVSSDGSAGGVQQALASLVKALNRTPDAGIEFVLLVGPRGHEWLTRGLGLRFRVDEKPRTLLPRARPGLPAWPRLRIHVAQAAALARRLGRMARGQQPLTTAAAWVRRSGADVVHFPYQEAFPTSVPTIFNPWDLQHLSLPQYFAPAVRLERQQRYVEACAAARRVVAATDWTRRDLHHRLGVPLEKIVVIPVPPFNEGLPAPAPEELEAVRWRLGLEPPFLLYPAQAFPHKNHLRLLEAVAELRQRLPDVRCVFTGAESPFTATIAQRASELGLGAHVRFVGFVDDHTLRALYRLSRLVVFPSSYEGLGLPLLEAFAEGVPVASSNATCLREVGQDAALFFSPEDVREMVDVIAGLWASAPRRQDLVERGRRRLEFFAGERTALAHLGLYREVGNRAVRAGERDALASFGNPASGEAG